MAIKIQLQVPQGHYPPQYTCVGIPFEQFDFLQAPSLYKGLENGEWKLSLYEFNASDQLETRSRADICTTYGSALASSYAITVIALLNVWRNRLAVMVL